MNGWSWFTFFSPSPFGNRIFPIPVQLRVRIKLNGEIMHYKDKRETGKKVATS
jgi:hypothetical protein